MALKNANKIAWAYTDDAGVDWWCSAEKAITDQLNVAAVIVGGSATVTGLNPWPSSWRKRKSYYAFGGKIRAVTCYDTTCDAWTAAKDTAAAQLSLDNGADVSNFLPTGIHLGERKRAATSSTS